MQVTSRRVSGKEGEHAHISFLYGIRCAMSIIFHTQREYITVLSIFFGIDYMDDFVRCK